MVTKLTCPKCGACENETTFDDKYAYAGEHIENGQKLYCSAVCPHCETEFEYIEVYEFKGFEDMFIRQ